MSLVGLVCRTISPTHDLSWAAAAAAPMPRSAGNRASTIERMDSFIVFPFHAGKRFERYLIAYPASVCLVPIAAHVHRKQERGQHSPLNTQPIGLSPLRASCVCVQIRQAQCNPFNHYCVWTYDNPWQSLNIDMVQKAVRFG